jgi:hypothetical protein
MLTGWVQSRISSTDRCGLLVAGSIAWIKLSGSTIRKEQDSIASDLASRLVGASEPYCRRHSEAGVEDDKFGIHPMLLQSRWIGGIMAPALAGPNRLSCIG